MANEDDDEPKVQLVKIPTFNGKKASWKKWSEKFLVRARAKGYRDIMTKDDKVIPTAPEPTSGYTQEEKLILQKNEIAYMELITTMDDSSGSNVAFGVVTGSKTTDFPDGNVRVAWKALKRKYQPTRNPTLASVHRAFWHAKLKRGQDPDVYITTLEEQQQRMKEMNSRVMDKHFVLHVLNSLTDDYERQIENLEEKLDSDNFSIEDFREVLTLRFERLQGRNKNSEYDEDYEEENDQALVTGSFARIYNWCGKRGHKRLNADNAKMGIKNPRSLGRKAVKETDKQGLVDSEDFVFTVKGRATKRQNVERKRQTKVWWKRPSKCNSTKVAEICLPCVGTTKVIVRNAKECNGMYSKKHSPKVCQQERETKTEKSDGICMLVNKEAKKAEKDVLWLADGGATTHMGPDDAELFNVRQEKSETKIGIAKKIMETKIGDKPMTIIQKGGKTINIVLKDYKYVSELWVNLFSITKALKGGWNIGNEGMMMFLKKGDVQLHFDQQVDTQDGLLQGCQMRTTSTVREFHFLLSARQPFPIVPCSDTGILLVPLFPENVILCLSS